MLKCTIKMYLLWDSNACPTNKTQLFDKQFYFEVGIHVNSCKNHFDLIQIIICLTTVDTDLDNGAKPTLITSVRRQLHKTYSFFRNYHKWKANNSITQKTSSHKIRYKL